MIVKEKISVRGTSHYRSSISAYNLGYLTTDAYLLLKAEPTNPVDKNAIEIFLKKPSFKLGYVPRELALKYTRLIVGGRINWAAISSVALEGSYLKIKAEICYRYVNDAVKNSLFWTTALNMPYTSGVYSITNTTSGRKYIGSSKKVRVRIFSHILDLSYGIHSNVPLQQDYNIYGPEQFEAKVTAKVPCEHLKTAEESAILELIHKKYPLYNMTTTGEPLERGPTGGTLSVSQWMYEDFEYDENDNDINFEWINAYSEFHEKSYLDQSSSTSGTKETERIHFVFGKDDNSKQTATDQASTPTSKAPELQKPSGTFPTENKNSAWQLAEAEAYKRFPFLDIGNRNSNIDAIIEVKKRTVDLEIKGLSPSEAYSRALQEIGIKYARPG